MPMCKNRQKSIHSDTGPVICTCIDPQLYRYICPLNENWYQFSYNTGAFRSVQLLLPQETFTRNPFNGYKKIKVLDTLNVIVIGKRHVLLYNPGSSSYQTIPFKNNIHHQVPLQEFVCFITTRLQELYLLGHHQSQ